MDRAMLARATEGTEAPTPGYLYGDLAKAASANPNACQEMANYLTRRLASKNNPNIKFKCCKVIAKLCDAVPRNHFRRCIAQDPNSVTSIKEAMNYRGTLDPVRGDEPNQKVRLAAKEALDAVYREAPSSEMPPSSSSTTMATGGMSSSYGPSPHAGYGGSSSSSLGGGGGALPTPGSMTGGGPRRMEGIGNPRYSDPRLDPRYNGSQPTTIASSIKEAGEVVMNMIKDPLARNIPDPGSVPRQGHSGNLPGYGPTYGRPPPGASELSRQTGGQWTMASNRGPGAVVPPPNFEQDQAYYKNRENNAYQWAQKTPGSASTVSSGSVGGSWGTVVTAVPVTNYGTPSVTLQSAPGATSGLGVTAAQDGSYEKNLIIELCPPGGLKPVPPPDKLAAFAQAVPSLNADLVCPVLLDLLEEGQPWLIRAKALWVMEACIQYGTRADGSNPYLDFFHACRDEIGPLASHARAAIKEPALRVLKLLGVESPADSTPAAPRSTASSAAVSTPAPNLLDFGDEDDNYSQLSPVDNVNQDTPSYPAAQPPQPPPSQAPPPPPTASSAPSTGPSLFGGMQVKSAAPAPETSSQNDNLLDFQPSPAPATSAPPVDAFADNSHDMFRAAMDTPLTTAPAPATNSSNSMFAQMSLKDSEDKKMENDDVGDLKSFMTTEPGASAFGFINSSESALPPPATKESFDPLLNVTPQSAQRKVMQLSQEQMQAMAYQQMMMQQQMQQMQLAMAMQQQRATSGGRAYPGVNMGMPAAMFPTAGAPVAGSGMPTTGAAGLGGGMNSKMPPMMSHPNSAASSGFSFMDARPVKQDDRKFDFVKAAMQTETKKK